MLALLVHASVQYPSFRSCIAALRFADAWVPTARVPAQLTGSWVEHWQLKGYRGFLEAKTVKGTHTAIQHTHSGKPAHPCLCSCWDDQPNWSAEYIN